jgi:ATP-dependent Lon protease
LRRVGTVAEILRYVTSEDTHYVICRGLRRFRVEEFLSGFPHLVARIKEIGISEVMTPEVEARMRLLKARAREAIQLLPNLPVEIPAAIDSLESPSALADFLAGIIDIPVSEKQGLLETFDVTQLLDKLLGLLASESRCCNSRRKSVIRRSRPCHRSSVNTSFANSFAKSRKSWATTTSNQRN